MILMHAVILYICSVFTFFFSSFFLSINKVNSLGNSTSLVPGTAVIVFIAWRGLRDGAQTCHQDKSTIFQGSAQVNLSIRWRLSSVWSHLCRVSGVQLSPWDPWPGPIGWLALFEASVREEAGGCRWVFHPLWGLFGI